MARRRKTNADLIRAKFDEMGWDASPAEVVRRIDAENKRKVSGTQVSQIKSDHNAGNGKATTRVAATAAKRMPASHGELSMSQLTMAKEFAETIGGLDLAQEAVAGLLALQA